MKNKKSKKANLENSKPMFLMIGLILAIAFVASAFQWQSEKKVIKFNEDNYNIVEVLPTITRNDIYEDKKTNVKKDNNEKTEQIVTDILITNSISKNEKEAVVIKEPISNLTINEIPEPEPDTTYVFTEEMPKFPGGTLALRRWIGKNVDYPAFARENRIQGTVYLKFEVTKDGSIGKIELQKGIDVLLDEEAIKVIKKLPHFKPGKHNGKTVNVWYSIPISFKLN